MTETVMLSTDRGVFALRCNGGSGPVVLCVHGFPDDASTWDRLAADLARAGYCVHAVNLRGYAPSPLDGSLDLADLVADLRAVVDAVSPDAPVHLVGHDYGAQLSYSLLAQAPERFRTATLLAGAHPAVLQRNARRSLRQLWASRYIVYFQLGALADRRIPRHDFAYVTRLWKRWAAVGFVPAADHLRHVKDTLRASWPAPVAMYRAGGFVVPEDPVDVPTLYVTGEDDGCALPFLADGQERLFRHGYESQRWAGVGHFPHLEDPDRTSRTLLEWIGRDRTSPPPGRQDSSP